MVIAFLTSIYNIFILKTKYSDSRKVYEEIREEKESLNLSNINSDYMGWINISDTPIDYPIVKSNDNEFYLTRDFYKQYLFSGSIFMDYRNEGFEDKNVVIYGHSMKDLSMFGSLKKLKNLDYLQQNKTISITTKENKKLIYQIFGVYVMEPNDTEAISINFNTDDEFISYIDKIMNKSIYTSDLEVNNIDKILTLYTCSYGFDDARLIIHAKLINK